MEAIEGLRFLASLPLASTGRTEGGQKTQPFNRFHSCLFRLASDRSLKVCYDKTLVNLEGAYAWPQQKVLLLLQN